MQLWVHDSHAGGFQEECRRQSKLAAGNTRAENDVMRWIDATRDTEGWIR